MRTHQEIDERSMAMAELITAHIDADPTHAGLIKARQVCEYWLTLESVEKDVFVWHEILQQEWPHVRAVLLNPSENGNRLRQSSPFIGILTKQERNLIYKRYGNHDKTSA